MRPKARKGFEAACILVQLRAIGRLQARSRKKKQEIRNEMQENGERLQSTDTAAGRRARAQPA
jgi:hypothetical protein